MNSGFVGAKGTSFGGIGGITKTGGLPAGEAGFLTAGGAGEITGGIIGSDGGVGGVGAGTAGADLNSGALNSVSLKVKGAGAGVETGFSSFLETGMPRSPFIVRTTISSSGFWTGSAIWMEFKK